jgi:hypothetical protein
MVADIASNGHLPDFIHNQGNSFLCWNYAIVTCMQNAIRRFSDQLKLEEVITEEEYAEIKKNSRTRTFHYTSRKAINYFAVLRSPSKEDGNNHEQAAYVEACLEKLCSPRYFSVNIGWFHML